MPSRLVRWRWSTRMAPAAPELEPGVERRARCSARRRGRARRGRPRRRPSRGERPARLEALDRGAAAARRCRSARTASATRAPMSGSSVRIGWAPASTQRDLGAAPARTPRPSRGRCSRRRPRPRVRQRSASDRVEQGLGVVERLHAVDPGPVDAGQVGPQRPGAGGDVEQVEAEVERAVLVERPHLEPAGVEVDRP